MTSQFNFNGVISAMPTPFLNKAIDYTSLKRMLEFQLKNGINGFVVNGTTAESPTLTWSEVEKIYSLTREIAGQRVPIIVGTGSNSTDDTVEKTKKATDMGADAALVVVPYYNKPPQRGLEAHFKAVAESTKMPIILYNVPGRTITAMTEETILSLSKVQNVIGIKEASGDVVFDEKLKGHVPTDFVMLSGDDPTYFDFLKIIKNIQFHYSQTCGPVNHHRESHKNTIKSGRPTSAACPAEKTCYNPQRSSPTTASAL